MKKVKWPLLAVAVIGTLGAFASKKFAGETTFLKPDGLYYLVEGQQGQPNGWDCVSAPSQQCTYTVKAGITHGEPFTASEVTPIPATTNYRYVKL